MFVGKLRSNPNREIARAAAELVIKWKRLVEAEKKSKTSKMASPAPTATPSPSLPKASVGGGTKKRYAGNPEKRSFKVDQVDIKRTGSDTRDNCIGVIYNGLAYNSTESEGDVLAKAAAVEHHAFKEYNGETDAYKKKCRSLFLQMKNKTNPELAKRVMSGEITPERFVVMSDEDLKSETQRKKEIEYEKENMSKAQAPMAEKSISDSLECSKCKKKMVSYTQAQTRSADEPMTTFCECLHCGNRWKVSLPPSPFTPEDRCADFASSPRQRRTEEGEAEAFLELQATFTSVLHYSAWREEGSFMAGLLVLLYHHRSRERRCRHLEAPGSHSSFT